MEYKLLEQQHHLNLSIIYTLFKMFFYPRFYKVGQMRSQSYPHLIPCIIIMVKYLSGSTIWLLFIGLLLSIQASKVPPPICNSPRVNFQDFPISLRQTQNYNMNDYFQGYNLNLTLLDKQDFVYIRNKVTKIKSSEKAQPGLRNYHLSHDGNQWGNTLVTISAQGNITRLRWGSSLVNSSTIPDLTDDVIVESDPKTTCYDAVWFRAQMLALVDCSVSTVLGLQNVFIFVNTTDRTIVSRVKNDLYVPFNVIWHRKIRLHTQNNYHYLIRAYFAEHVDDHYSTNTYAEILSVNNPLKPFTIRVMDRSFLHQDRLSITDFQVYLGDIYILDYHSGVIKFDISLAQTIVITGRYRTDSGFTKLGVYSNNLDNQFLLVLAHDHAIFEVDWSNQIKPEIVTKYSIPDNAWIHDLWVNNQYVVVQLTANLTNDQGQIQSTQSTYVFNRGTRAYLNAYAAIPHVNFHSFVDFNRGNSQMLTIDTERMVVSQLSVPTVSIMPQTSDLLGKEFVVTINGESKNQYSGAAKYCNFTFRFIVVAGDSYALWPTGLNIPETYYANYPGQLFIPLDRYVLGSNITWGIVDEYDPDPPVYYVLQQNTTRIFWNRTPSISKYVFLRQEQYDSIDQTDLYLYTQDYNNATHFSRCQTVPYTDQVQCRESGFVPHINFRIANITANRFHYYEGRYIHLVAILYRDLPTQVFIYTVGNRVDQELRPIMFPEGFEGTIASIQFVGHYLVVVLKYVKEIVFFDMIQCYDTQDKECKQNFRITPRNMTNIGVNYFSPVQIYYSDFHPYVLFVQCLDRVLILDVTRTGVIKLAEVLSPATKEPGFYKWKMAIARGELILVNPPNTIEEHDLDQLYTSKAVTMTKVFPTYGYVIQDNFDLDFSDVGNLVYITGTDPKLPADKNTVILVYRSGFPAVSSFYDVFNLYGKYQDVLVDATGNFGDYVAVAYGNTLQIFRQYQIPILVFQDSFSDYSFNITYTNDPLSRFHYLRKSKVKIANYPQDIVINDTKLNDNNYLTGNINLTNQYTIFHDETWFNGSVINYTLVDCDQCNDKIKIISHVSQQRQLLGSQDMEDYAFSTDGGFIQQYQSIIKMRHNGSIHQFVFFPSVLDGESCISIEHSWIYDYTLSACKQGFQIYLYTTVYTASKPFVNGPYYSSAKHVTSMHVMEQLMIVVDVDETPWAFDREGGVIIYAMNHDPFEPEIFDEIQFIDTNDLIAANDWPGGPCFIANAHFSFINITNTYRLVITELRSGLFIVDFRWVKGRKSVQILKVEYIDLVVQLNRIQLPLPNAAFFTAIAINKESLNKETNYWQSELIVSTSNFHTFQINVYSDNKTGAVVAHNIAKIFYRYGFYENQNYIKAFDGYFAIAQRLPTMLQVFEMYSQLVLSVYDTREHWTFNAETGQKTLIEPAYHAGTKIPVSYLLGGYTFRKGRVAFDWNFTLTRNASDPFRAIGLVALHNRDFRIRGLRVHQKLILETMPGISSTQNAKLRARNDYHFKDIPFRIFIEGSDSTLAGWAIALIVIGSVAVAAGVGFFVYLKMIKGKRPNRESEVEKSLLEKQGEGQEDSDEDDSDEDDDDEEDQQEEVQVETGKPSEIKVSTQVGEPELAESINRETITSVDEAERHSEDEKPPIGEEKPKADE